MTTNASWERVCPSCGAPFSAGEEFCPHDGSPLVASQKQAIADKMLNQVLDGRFVLQRVLGVGGMGVVYLARHRVLEKPFAVKMLRRELSGDLLARRRFEREARIASSVMQHPNIVQIYDSGHTEDGRAYLVMEYVDGVSLHQLAGNAPNRQLHLGQTVDIVLQLVQALIAAHSRGIVHRDIKPDNISSVEKAGSVVRTSSLMARTICDLPVSSRPGLCRMGSRSSARLGGDVRTHRTSGTKVVLDVWSRCASGLGPREDQFVRSPRTCAFLRSRQSKREPLDKADYFPSGQSSRTC